MKILVTISFHFKQSIQSIIYITPMKSLFCNARVFSHVYNIFIRGQICCLESTYTEFILYEKTHFTILFSSRCLAPTNNITNGLFLFRLHHFQFQITKCEFWSKRQGSRGIFYRLLNCTKLIFLALQIT